MKKVFESFHDINESKNIKKLADEISKSIYMIDDLMSSEEFAIAVGEVLKEEYGSHNYEKFVKSLRKFLKI